MFHIFSTWGVGVMNGLWQDHKGLPTGYKYGTIALASGIQIAKTIGTLDAAAIARPGPTMVGTFVGIPILLGSIFCTGHFFGKSATYLIKDGSTKISESLNNMGNWELKPKPKAK